MKIYSFLLLSFCLIGPVECQVDSLKQHFNIREDGVAIQGFDVVSYFDGQALRGDAAYSIMYKGITFWFSSTTNVKKFEKNPEEYLPQFGGWCATGMAFELVNSKWLSGKYKVDPKNFMVEDGKLYLFYNFDGYDAKPDWIKLKSKLQPEADATWRRLLSH